MFKALGSKELKSFSAGEHGVTRRRQGYTAAMLVEKSRILQVTIFHTLQKNLASIDFSTLLMSVMTIADEVDSQLSQTMRATLPLTWAVCRRRREPGSVVADLHGRRNDIVIRVRWSLGNPRARRGCGHHSGV